MRPLLPRQARPRAHRLRHGGGAAPALLRASVSSVQRTQETRLAAPRSGLRRASRPHQPSGGSEGSRSRSLNRRGGRWPRPPLVSLPTCGSLWAFGPSAHWARASLRCPPSCIPNPATCAADSEALRKQGYLTPAAARRANGAAAGEVGGRRNPAEKIGASRAFPTRSYSILASASLTSSIRRATWEGVSTGWLNSTVWFTVTGAAACVCAASRS